MKNVITFIAGSAAGLMTMVLLNVYLFDQVMSKELLMRSALTILPAMVVVMLILLWKKRRSEQSK